MPYISCMRDDWYAHYDCTCWDWLGRNEKLLVFQRAWFEVHDCITGAWPEREFKQLNERKLHGISLASKDPTYQSHPKLVMWSITGPYQLYGHFI